MSVHQYWLVLAVLAATAEGASSANEQPWGGKQDNYPQDQHMAAAAIRPHEQAAHGRSNQAAYQVTAGGDIAQVGLDDHHTLIRSQPPASFATDSQVPPATQQPAPMQPATQRPAAGPVFAPAPAPVYAPAPAPYGQQPGYSGQQPQQGQPPNGQRRSAFGAQRYTGGGAGGAKRPAPYTSGFASPSPTPLTAMMNGACVVPVWTKGKQDYLCEEGAESKLELEIEEQDEKLIKDGGTCTVVCPRWWMAPTPATLECKKHEWDSKGDVKCVASKKVGACLFALFLATIGGVYYYRQQQQLKQQQGMMPQQDPYAQPPPMAAPAAQAEQQPPQ